MDIETSGSNGNPLDIAPRDTAILNHKGETQSAGPSDPQLSKQGENPSELDSVRYFKNVMVSKYTPLY